VRRLLLQLVWSLLALWITVSSFGAFFYGPVGCSSVLVPARGVRALNLNLDDGFVLDHGNYMTLFFYCFVLPR
jgi:hypothetical protein